MNIAQSYSNTHNFLQSPILDEEFESQKEQIINLAWEVRHAGYHIAVHQSERELCIRHKLNGVQKVESFTKGYVHDTYRMMTFKLILKAMVGDQ